MSKHTHRIVIFLYNRLFDSLIQGNFWMYIDSYLQEPSTIIRFHVVTYEDSRFPLTEAQLQKLAQWQRQGLEWTQLRWHPGTGIRGKLLDVASGLNAVLKLRLNGYRHIVTLGSVAGTYAYLYAQIGRASCRERV